MENIQSTLSRIILISMMLLLAGTAMAKAPTIRSEAPQLPPKTIELVESWRVGGEDGDLIFGMMIDSIEDDEGNIYLLDSQMCQVEVFSPAGEHLRTLSRQGEGPGEIQNPQNLVLLPGRTLGILELFPAGIVTLSLEGDPTGNLKIGGENGPRTGTSAAFQVSCGGGTILVAAQQSAPAETSQQRTQYLVRISETGEEEVRFREAKMSIDFAHPEFVEREIFPPFYLATTVDDEGKVYTPRDRTQYAIEVYNPDGSLEKIIERKFQNRKRDKQEMGRLNALIDVWTRGFPGEFPRKLDENEPSISDLHVDDQGVLWVQHSRSGRDQPEGVLFTYDTFSPEGEWLQEVSIKAEGNPVYDGLRFLGGDRVLLIKGYTLARWASLGAKDADFGEGEAEPMEVIFCRMTND